FRNLKNQFVPSLRHAPKKFRRLTTGARAQDHHRLSVDAARRLGSRASSILKWPGHAVEIQDHAGTGRPPADLGPVHSYHLAFGVRRNPQRETLRWGYSGERGSGRVQLPTSENPPLGPADTD